MAAGPAAGRRWHLGQVFKKKASGLLCLWAPASVISVEGASSNICSAHSFADDGLSEKEAPFRDAVSVSTSQGTQES